jgi:LmbE family N-acetylglucosaminyl deacetylase
MKLLVLITTYKKNTGRVKTIQNTWAKSLQKKNIPYYFISGDNIDIDAPFIHLKEFTESYEQLPLKTFHILSESLKHDYDLLIKTDDDTFLNIDLLNEDILNFDYIGKFNEPKYAPNIHYYKCSGEFKVPKKAAKYKYAEGGVYILSRKAVQKIVDTPQETFINTPENYKGEDVMVGDLLHEDRFSKLDIKDAHLSKTLNMDVTKNGFSFHPVHNIIMPKIYNLNLDEQTKILLENPVLNDYNRRDIYIKKSMADKVLVFAPHGDDEVLGCGGTICKHAKNLSEVYVVFIRKRYDERSEYQMKCAQEAKGILGIKDSYNLNLGDDVIFNKLALIQELEKVVNLIKPSTVYCPFYGDLHQDHRAVFEAVNVATRAWAEHRVNKILLYETISSTDQGLFNTIHPFIPNYFVPLTQDQINFKLTALKAYDKELKGPDHPRSLDNVLAKARITGRQIHEPFAEAFMCVRNIV